MLNDPNSKSKTSHKKFLTRGRFSFETSNVYGSGALPLVQCSTEGDGSKSLIQPKPTILTAPIQAQAPDSGPSSRAGVDAYKIGRAGKKAGNIFYVNFFDEITDAKVRGLMAVCAEIVGKKHPDALYFLFSSPGGSVRAGITLHNYLRGLPCRIVMHNTGTIDSIATVVFLAGEERYAAPGSSFLFHGVNTTFQANSRLNRGRLAEILSSLREDENKIASIVANNCRLTDEEMRQLFQQGEAKDLDFAVEKGIIQEVREVGLPPNANFLSINFK